MLNQVVLVGRISHDLKIKEIEENKKELDLILAVSRSYKNKDGIYETGFINCKVYENIIDSTFKHCKKGDVVGIRGRLQVINDNMIVIAERISFLTSKGAK